MSNRSHFCGITVTVSLMLIWAGSARGQETAAEAKVQNVATMKFVTFPGLPPCAKGSVQSGDPTKGSSIILLKAAAGCSIPWHWHTPNEHLMMVSGAGQAQTKDGKPVTLRAGGFALMPSRHVHRFRCSGPCSLYLYSDAAFDLHYVDGQGKEIAPEVALKAVKEVPATEMKSGRGRGRRNRAPFESCRPNTF